MGGEDRSLCFHTRCVDPKPRDLWRSIAVKLGSRIPASGSFPALDTSSSLCSTSDRAFSSLLHIRCSVRIFNVPLSGSGISLLSGAGIFLAQFPMAVVSRCFSSGLLSWGGVRYTQCITVRLECVPFLEPTLFDASLSGISPISDTLAISDCDVFSLFLIRTSELGVAFDTPSASQCDFY